MMGLIVHKGSNNSSELVGSFGIYVRIVHYCTLPVHINNHVVLLVFKTNSR